MNLARTQRNQNKLNLAVDIAIFITFLVTMAPHFSGIAIHEWLSIAFGAAIVAHLLLHWQWLVSATRRFFDKLSRSARINDVLNALLFIDTTIVIFTGMLISESVLPLLGVTLTPNGGWRVVHTLSADLSLMLVGLHVALHWQWIVNVASCSVSTARLRRGRASQLAATHMEKEV